ncbi:hypothetical protein BKA70DRAFT_1227669 [Coprinopsis sp. MPI-PUGE-AT-0042]|nr:hypothetical protein BKA70DRAFT_1227669 [Coprinopsis sp. MPI-PUGE-AT-0042]
MKAYTLEYIQSLVNTVDDLVKDGRSTVKCLLVPSDSRVPVLVPVLVDVGFKSFVSASDLDPSTYVARERAQDPFAVDLDPVIVLEIPPPIPASQSKYSVFYSVKSSTNEFLRSNLCADLWLGSTCGVYGNLLQTARRHLTWGMNPTLSKLVVSMGELEDALTKSGGGVVGSLACKPLSYGSAWSGGPSTFPTVTVIVPAGCVEAFVVAMPVGLQWEEERSAAFKICVLESTGNVFRALTVGYSSDDYVVITSTSIYIAYPSLTLTGQSLPSQWVTKSGANNSPAASTTSVSFSSLRCGGGCPATFRKPRSLNSIFVFFWNNNVELALLPSGDRSMRLPSPLPPNDVGWDNAWLSGWGSHAAAATVQHMFFPGYVWSLQWGLPDMDDVDPLWAKEIRLVFAQITTTVYPLHHGHRVYEIPSSSLMPAQAAVTVKSVICGVYCPDKSSCTRSVQPAHLDTTILAKSVTSGLNLSILLDVSLRQVYLLDILSRLFRCLQRSVISFGSCCDMVSRQEATLLALLSLHHFSVPPGSFSAYLRHAMSTLVRSGYCSPPESLPHQCSLFTGGGHRLPTIKGEVLDDHIVYANNLTIHGSDFSYVDYVPRYQLEEVLATSPTSIGVLIPLELLGTLVAPSAAARAKASLQKKRESWKRNGFCRDMAPESFEESGCCICGGLYPPS